jgi:PAS domain-containing protein
VVRGSYSGLTARPCRMGRPLAMAVKEQRPIRGIEAVASPDGTRVPFIPFHTPLTLGKFIGAINILVDITDRKRAELYAQQLIVESSDDAIVSRDFNGIITNWNRGAIVGYTADEVIGESVTILIRLIEDDWLAIAKAVVEHLKRRWEFSRSPSESTG